jgi:hypothetical protein
MGARVEVGLSVDEGRMPLLALPTIDTLGM